MFCETDGVEKKDQNLFLRIPSPSLEYYYTLLRNADLTSTKRLIIIWNAASNWNTHVNTNMDKRHLQCRRRAAGYPHLAHVFFWIWNDLCPHLRQKVWVLLCRFPKLDVPLVWMRKSEINGVKSKKWNKIFRFIFSSTEWGSIESHDAIDLLRWAGWLLIYHWMRQRK